MKLSNLLKKRKNNHNTIQCNEIKIHSIVNYKLKKSEIENINNYISGEKGLYIKLLSLYDKIKNNTYLDNRMNFIISLAEDDVNKYYEYIKIIKKELI